MIRCLYFRPDTGLQEATTGYLTLLARWRNEPDSMLWLDLHAVDPAQEAELLRSLDIHQLAIEDAQRERHPPKVEAFDDYVFVLLRGLDASSDSINLRTIQLAFFVGDRILITRHVGESVSINLLWARCSEQQRLPESLAQLACSIWGMVRERYLPILLGLEARLGELEDELVERPDDELLAELTGYKTRLRKVRRNFSYHERLFSRLRAGGMPYFDASLGHQVHDVYEGFERLRSLSDMYYEVTGDLIEGYISMASHRLNQIMKVLTIVTTIFVPLGFLAGIYGMNFDNMPELHSRYGYFVLLSVMFTVAGGLLLLFRWRRWL